jgi:hypothetical protein
MKGILSCLLMAGVLMYASGCSTTDSTKAKPLNPALGASLDLATYSIATVQPFEHPNRSLEHPDAGLIMGNSLARRMRADFGRLFEEVRQGDPLGRSDEVIITGVVKEYQPGSRLGRAFGPGITPARFKAELHLKDGATGRTLLVAPIEKLWAWGHGIGAAKGIEDMMQESAAAAAATIAKAKGWEAAK